MTTASYTVVPYNSAWRVQREDGTFCCEDMDQTIPIDFETQEKAEEFIEALNKAFSVATGLLQNKRLLN